MSNKNRKNENPAADEITVSEPTGPTVNDADGNPVPLTETRDLTWQEKELLAQQEITREQEKARKDSEDE